MPKTYIIPIDHSYPFVLNTQRQLPPGCIIKVRRSIAISDMSKALTNKILFVNNLRNKNLVKIQSITQSSSALQINYQYIKSPQILEGVEFWEAIIPQLTSFTEYLINIGVKTNISTHRIGVTVEGILKYYLGLQFDLSEDMDEEILQQHYQKQLSAIQKNFGLSQTEQYHPIDQYQLNQSTQLMRYQDRSIQKYRKDSVATMPSYNQNVYNLNAQLNRIKTSVRQLAKCRYANQNRQIKYSRTQKQESFYNQYQQGGKYKQVSQKRQLNRKLSGDSRAFLQQNRKLSAKYSDFRNERKNSKQFSQKSVFKIEGGRIKSKMQQIKYQQYVQIANTQNKNKYLKQFVSVLEDNEGQMQFIEQPKQLKAIGIGQSKQRQYRPFNSNHQVNQVDLLKLKVQQSIKNSLKIINKVKGVC